MNPLLILGAIGIGWMLFGKKSTPAATQPAGTFALPTATTPGSVSVTVPSTGQTPSVLTPPTIVQVPETTITGSPADTSLLLTAAETNILASGTNDQIYQAATSSSHPAFVSAAGLVLTGKGDARGPQVAQSATQL